LFDNFDLWMGCAMKIKARAFTICAMALLLTSLAGCVNNLINNLVNKGSSGNNAPPTTALNGTTSTATTLDGYKRDLAHRIAAANSSSVYTGHPQALLRAVIVLKFYIDADGKLLRTEIMRTNKDLAAEALALSSVRSAAPFPKPESRLLRRGEVEISESWLFNNDGRFQLRSIAEAQMGE
jgi:protein TonB